MAREKHGSALLFRQEGDKHLLLARHDIYVMNEFSREMLELCDGSRTVDDLVGFVVAKYELTRDEALPEVQKFLDYAQDKHLVTLER